MLLLCLFAIFCAFPGVSSKRCKTNNDCESGRCEWRRCVGQLGRIVSGRKEADTCYVDQDCPKGKLCTFNLCKDRQPLMTKINKGKFECLVDEDCPANQYCGFYKKCYDTSGNSKYVQESFMHIPCIKEPHDFCPKVTGFPDAICGPIEFPNENILTHICQLPPPFEIAGTPSCTDGQCTRYNRCLHGTCYNPFWHTVRERCTSDDQCTYRAQCDKSKGTCYMQYPFSFHFTPCRTTAQCNDPKKPTIVKFVCAAFECKYRRVQLLECQACKLDEYCNLHEDCIRVQRPMDVNCEGSNWFYWYRAFYCSMKKNVTYAEAEKECKHLGAELAQSPDRGDEKYFVLERAMLAYLAVRDGWVKENTGKVEEKFTNWTKSSERNAKSYFFCKKNVPSQYVPNNATAFVAQRCQTSFIYRNGFCYIGGFTNFMPRFAIRSVCNLLDSEIAEIQSQEEARFVYGLAGGRSYWLGLQKGKRNWFWDGGPYGHRARFFLWRTGQPDTTNNQICAYSPNAGEWKTADCDKFIEPITYICKREAYKQ